MLRLALCRCLPPSSPGNTAHRPRWPSTITSSTKEDADHPHAGPDLRDRSRPGSPSPVRSLEAKSLNHAPVRLSAALAMSEPLCFRSGPMPDRSPPVVDRFRRARLAQAAPAGVPAASAFAPGALQQSSWLTSECRPRGLSHPMIEAGFGSFRKRSRIRQLARTGSVRRAPADPISKRRGAHRRRRVLPATHFGNSRSRI